jgi:polyhydroxyalkanoate synthesis regulator phasin
LSAKEEEQRRVVARLTDRIDLLERELSDCHEKEQQSRKFNESILQTMQMKESTLEQNNEQEIGLLVMKHEEEIKRMRFRHAEESKEKERAIEGLKKENERLKTEVTRK